MGSCEGLSLECWYCWVKAEICLANLQYVYVWYVWSTSNLILAFYVSCFQWVLRFLFFTVFWETKNSFNYKSIYCMYVVTVLLNWIGFWFILLSNTRTPPHPLVVICSTVIFAHPYPAPSPMSDSVTATVLHGERTLSHCSSSVKSPQSLSPLHMSRLLIHWPAWRQKARIKNQLCLHLISLLGWIIKRILCCFILFNKICIYFTCNNYEVNTDKYFDIFLY